MRYLGLTTGATFQLRSCLEKLSWRVKGEKRKNGRRSTAGEFLIIEDVPWGKKLPSKNKRRET
jgi:hypothetical protein